MKTILGWLSINAMVVRCVAELFTKHCLPFFPTFLLLPLFAHQLFSMSDCAADQILQHRHCRLCSSFSSHSSSTQSTELWEWTQVIKVLKGCPVLCSSSNYEGGPFTKELLVEHAIKSPIIYQLNLYISEIGYSFLCASTFKYLLKTIKKVQNIFNIEQLMQKKS